MNGTNAITITRRKDELIRVMETNLIFVLNYEWKADYSEPGLLIKHHLTDKRLCLFLSVTKTEALGDTFSEQEMVDLECNVITSNDKAIYEEDRYLLTFPPSVKDSVFRHHWRKDCRIQLKIYLGNKQDLLLDKRSFTTKPQHPNIFFNNSLFSDVIFIIKARHLFDKNDEHDNDKATLGVIEGHRAILANRSPFFKNYFLTSSTGAENQAKTNNKLQIIIPTRFLSSVSIIMEHIYNQVIPESLNDQLQLTNLMELYQLAELWNIHSIQFRVSQLIYHTLNSSNANYISQFCTLMGAEFPHYNAVYLWIHSNSNKLNSPASLLNGSS